MFWNKLHDLIIWIGYITGMSFLLKAVVCEISISYDTETMGNGFLMLICTCSKSAIETLEKGVKYV